MLPTRSLKRSKVEINTSPLLNFCELVSVARSAGTAAKLELTQCSKDDNFQSLPACSLSESMAILDSAIDSCHVELLVAERGNAVLRLQSRKETVNDR